MSVFSFRFSLLLTGAMLFAACFPSETLAFRKRPPKWVKQRPVDDQSYIGIGVAKIEKGSNDHVTVAKKNALNDLISEIQVTISSNSVLKQFEDNNEFKEEFEAVTSTSVRQNIEGYELVDSWNDKEAYWVYYRLSKAEYQKRKRERIQRAVDEAKAFYHEGLTSEKNQDIMGAIAQYARGLESVKWYLEEDLTTFVLDEGRIDLGSALLSSMQRVFSRLRIRPEKEILEARFSGGVPGYQKVQTFYQNEDGTESLVTGIKLGLSFTKGAGELTEKVTTNNTGQAQYSVAQVSAKIPIQEITVALDVESALGASIGKSLIGRMIESKGGIPNSRISVRVAPIVVYFKSTETAFGQRQERPVLAKGIKEALSDMSFRFTELLEEADVVIDIKSEAFKGEHLKAHNVYKVYLDMDFSIIDPSTGTKLYFKRIDQERGMQTKSYENALKEANDAALTRFLEEVIPEINAVRM